MQVSPSQEKLKIDQLLSETVRHYGIKSGTTASSNPCFDNTSKDTCLFVEQKDTIIDIGCDSCKAKVTYDLWVCFSDANNVIVAYVVFDNFHAVPHDDGGCDSLLLAWKTLADNGDTATLKGEMIKFRKKARDAVEWMEMERYVTTFKTVFDCNNKDYFAYTEFYEKTCVKWCVRFISFPFNGGSLESNWWYSIPCGSLCCRKTTQYCWDDNQQKVVKKESVVEPVGGNCTETSAKCKSGYIEFPCFGLCNVYYF